MSEVFLHAVADRLPELPDPIHVNMAENAAIETLIGNIAETSPEVAAELLTDADFAQWLIGGERHHGRHGQDRTDTAAFIGAAARHVAQHGDFESAAEMAILLGGARNPDATVEVAMAEAVGFLLPRLAEGIDPSNREAVAADLEESGLIDELVEAGLLESDASGTDALNLLESRLTDVAHLVSENDLARAELVGAVNAQALMLFSNLSSVGVADGDVSRLSSVTQELRAIMGIFGEGLFSGAIDAEAAAAATEKFIEGLITAPLGASIPGLKPGVAERLGSLPESVVNQASSGLVEALISVPSDLSRAEVLQHLETEIVDYANALSYQAALADPVLMQAIIDDVGVDIAVEDVTVEMLQQWASDAHEPTSSLLREIQAGFREALQDGIADAYIAADAG